MNGRAPSGCEFGEGEAADSLARLSETGESEESLPVEYHGSTVEIGFNAQYLLDFLRAVAEPAVGIPLQGCPERGRIAARRAKVIKLQLSLRGHANAHLKHPWRNRRVREFEHLR